MILQMRHRTEPQKRISRSTKRFNVACWGRQSGKTTYGLDKMVYKPLQGRPNGIYWYVLQTYSAANVAFYRYLRMIQNTPLLIERNKTQRSVQLSNGAMIYFKSGKNYEDLRAETLDGAIIDEVRQQDKDLWPMIIRPMLTRREGWCDFLSTTNGFDHFKDLYDFATLSPEHWAVFHAPSTEAPWWTQQELNDAKSVMSEDEFAQEILAEFREIGKGKAYKKHGPWNQVEQNPFAVTGCEYSPYLPIIVGLDFNVGLMAWALGQYKAGHFHYADEIAVENTDTDEMASLLVEHVKNHKPGVILIGDATGNARKTAAVGKTDYSIIMGKLKAAGITYRNLTPAVNPSVKDRINLVNARLKSADGTVNFTYNPKKCKRLKHDFERVTVKPGTDGFALDKSDILLTQASDAASYPVCYYAGEWKTKPGLLRVIQR